MHSHPPLSDFTFNFLLESHKTHVLKSVQFKQSGILSLQ